MIILLTFQGLLNPVKYSGIKRGKTTASSNKRFASSSSAISDLRAVRDEINYQCNL